MRPLLVLVLAALLLSAGHASLQMASVIFRHGHRNILRPYSFDPHSNASYWPGGIGQMTNRGKMQMYRLGQLLRERYGALLSEQYTPEEILVRSSSVPRCVSSALCVLAGLFPPTQQEVWNPDVLWQPVPVYADRTIKNNLIQSYMACPAYLQEFKRQMDAPDVREFNSNYSDVYRVISEHWEPVQDFELPNNLYDYFKIQEERGFTLPEWTAAMYPDKLRAISTMYQTFRTRSPLMVRLKMGPLVKELARRMSSSRDGTERQKRKLYLYSGHDDTIAGMLSVIGVANVLVVQYGAALFLELHANSTGQHEVKVFFMSNVDHGDIQEVQLPSCEPACGLDAFVEAMSPVIPADWDKECQLNDTDTDLPSEYLSPAIIY